MYGYVYLLIRSEVIKEGIIDGPSREASIIIKICLDMNATERDCSVGRERYDVI